MRAWPRQQHTWKPHVGLRACPHTKSLLLLSPWKCHGHTKVHPYEKHFEIVHRGGVSRRHQQPIYWIVTKCSFPCCQTKQLIENFRKVFDNRTRTVAPAIRKQKTTQTNSWALMRCGDAPTDRLLLLHINFTSLPFWLHVSSLSLQIPHEDPSFLSICLWGWFRHSTSHGHMGHSKCPSREYRWLELHRTELTPHSSAWTWHVWNDVIVLLTQLKQSPHTYLCQTAIDKRKSILKPLHTDAVSSVFSSESRGRAWKHSQNTIAWKGKHASALRLTSPLFGL